MDLKLTQAQIALFKGERAETLRLIQEYREIKGDADEPMVMWLDAQAQTGRLTLAAISISLLTFVIWLVLLSLQMRS